MFGVLCPQGSHSPAPTATASRSQVYSHEVDASEYEPQIVVLEEEGSNHTPDHAQQEVVDSDGGLGDSEVTTGKVQVEERRGSNLVSFPAHLRTGNETMVLLMGLHTLLSWLSAFPSPTGEAGSQQEPAMAEQAPEDEAEVHHSPNRLTSTFTDCQHHALPPKSCHHALFL